MGKPRSFFSRGRKVQTVERLVVEQQQAGFALQRAGSSDGGVWVVDGQPLRNFGSCSYMGLERHPELAAGAVSAIQEFGSNFSISRIYLECPLYADFEQALGEVMGRPVVVAASTTMCHLAALPVIVGDHDLVLLDQFVHSSVHMASDLIADVPIELLRHSRMDLLEQRLKQVESDDAVERVWYLCDGVYSMLGDLAPFEELSELLTRYPKLHLYVDDAHGMSWAGQHGRGTALDRLADLERVVVAVSLSKAFGATGGALAFPSTAMRDRVRRCGGPLMFSGPIAPAGLGSGLASAKLHLTPELAQMQRELQERITFARESVEAAGLELATKPLTPVMMVHYDSIPRLHAVMRGLRERGFFTCLSTFPAVPVNKPSLRFTISRHNSFADIEELVAAVAELSAQPKPSRVVGPPAAVDAGVSGLG